MEQSVWRGPQPRIPKGINWTFANRRVPSPKISIRGDNVFVQVAAHLLRLSKRSNDRRWRTTPSFNRDGIGVSAHQHVAAIAAGDNPAVSRGLYVDRSKRIQCDDLDGWKCSGAA